MKKLLITKSRRSFMQRRDRATGLVTSSTSS